MGALGFDKKTYIRLRDVSKVVPIMHSEPIVRFGDVVVDCDPEMSHVMAIDFQNLKVILQNLSLTSWQLLNILNHGTLFDISSQALLMPGMDYIQAHHARHPVPSVMRLVDMRSHTQMRMPIPMPRLPRGRGSRMPPPTQVVFPTMSLQ